MQPIASSAKRLKLIVLDSNFYWTEQLFSSCNEFADILLLRPRDFRAFKEQYGSYLIDLEPRSIAQGIWEQRICCPPGWLFHYWFLMEHFFLYIIRRFQGSDPALFVFSFPYYHSLVKKIKGHSIYYNIDDYCCYWPNRRKQTITAESRAVSKANVTLCVSNYRADSLSKKYPECNYKIVHLPHGCSLEFMVEEPLLKPRSLPLDLRDYSRPIAGYIGTLTDRFDFSFLAKAAERMPEITILLGGVQPKAEDGSAEWWRGVEHVRQLSNVHFIGLVPHERLGEYLQSFNVLLMCYSLCEFNLNACPTKLWDYMGTSLPIVTNTVVPEVNLWSDVLLMAEDPEEFAEKVKFALVHSQWRSLERLVIAKEHTWKNQAQKLYRLLEEKRCIPLLKN